MIVLLTIHGIGFQRAPSGLAATDGYADPLHEHLRAHLGDALGDDPNRVAEQGRGPVYTESSYPAHSNQTESGIGRLGSWTTSGSVDREGMDLAPKGAEIAHVALVYSGLEEQQGDVTALLGLNSLSAPVTDYATVGGLCADGAARPRSVATASGWGRLEYPQSQAAHGHHHASRNRIADSGPRCPRTRGLIGDRTPGDSAHGRR